MKDEDFFFCIDRHSYHVDLPHRCVRLKPFQMPKNLQSPPLYNNAGITQLKEPKVNEFDLRADVERAVHIALTSDSPINTGKASWKLEDETFIIPMTSDKSSFDVFLNFSNKDLMEIEQMLNRYPTPSLNKVANQFDTNSATITSLIRNNGWFTAQEYEDRWGDRSIRAGKGYRHSRQDIEHWLELFHDLKSLKDVREALLDEGRLAPKTSTIRKEIENIIGVNAYKKMIGKGLYKYTLEDLQQIARDVGLSKTGVAGQFLGLLDRSTTLGYIPNEVRGTKEKYLWRCGKCGTIFSKRLKKIISTESWCPECSRRERIKPYEELQEIAGRLGRKKTGYPGEVVTPREEYYQLENPSMQKIYWKCGKCENIFPATPNNVVSKDSWCPICSQGFKERVVRKSFEKIFKYRFPQTGLKDLIKYYDPMNYNEIEKKIIDNLLIWGHVDGYCSALNLAFEFQGLYHFEIIWRTRNKVPPEWYPGDYMSYVQEKDRVKKKLLAENRIPTIYIPYTDFDDHFQIILNYRNLYFSNNR